MEYCLHLQLTDGKEVNIFTFND